VAQTKRKRRTKHRGTPVGTIEARGRTGRKPTGSERGAKAGSKDGARERRLARMDQPPTWRSAANRAAIATALLLVALLLLFKTEPARAIALAGFAMIIYVPMGYYTDLFMYRRRQARKLRDKDKAKTKAKDGG
jgi:hypothetical protein